MTPPRFIIEGMVFYVTVRAVNRSFRFVPKRQVREAIDYALSVVLERLAEELPYSPSIDRVIEDVAERYGDAAGAIIFSGVSDDAVRGCSALAAKGGRVYTQSPESAVVSTMIDAVTETGVVSFSGSPKELAAKLIAGGT